MELEIKISKRGTKVVTATNLFKALELPKAQYTKIVKGWLNDIYEFHDGIRKPLRMQDFATRFRKEGVVDDYYLSVELAKAITLNSRSKVKHKYAKYLFGLEDKVENAELLTKEQVAAVLELTKVMGLVSCQTATEKQHLEVYSGRNNGNAADWWKFRSRLLGYDNTTLRKSLERLGKDYKGRSQRQMLMQLDKYEMIRIAVIDLFMGMGKSERYAKNIAALAKRFAEQLNVEIFDDRNTSMFTPEVNTELVEEVKSRKPGRLLQLWHVQAPPAMQAAS